MLTLTRPQKWSFGALVAAFTWFTWRGMLTFFSGDDMMNMTFAWDMNPWRLGRSVPMFWTPVYRPLGGVVYRVFYAVFGFHPEPLYIFMWLLLALNVYVAFRLYRVVLGAVWPALAAVAITLVHGRFQDLYTSAGTIYDRLCFLFTGLGVALYVEWRGKDRGLSLRQSIWICLMAVLAMDSKESGVAMVAILGLYEVMLVLPPALWTKTLGQRVRQVVPLFAVLGVMALVFVFLRVNKTPELMMTPAYRPRADLHLWLTRLGEYFGMLAYRPAALSPGVAAGILTAMIAAAALLRNRVMAFGLAFFALAVTPVALIASRPGYVLYVPDLGLSIYIAALVFSLVRLFRIPNKLDGLVFAVIAIAAIAFHATNWPPYFDPRILPELRLSEQLRQEYPTLPPKSRLLFVSDDFPSLSWDLAFNVRLFYNDHSIVVHRLNGPVDQRPERGQPLHYDHVFALGAGRYEELDNRDINESIRLHILQKYTVGRELDMSHRDHSAYVVSGVMDGDSAEIGRWTEPHAKFKFDVFPAPAFLTAKYWVPDFVAKGHRTMSVAVNGTEVAKVPLDHDGMNEIRLPVAAALISRTGYTLVDLDVSDPYKDAEGAAFGVIIVRAGFVY